MSTAPPITPPPALTWLHLCPPDASFSCEACPAWLNEPLARFSGNGQRIAVRFGSEDCDGLNDCAGAVFFNAKISPAQAAAAGFSYVRRFAAVPNLQNARWFVPLDGGAISQAAFGLYTPARASARLKRWAVETAARFSVPCWYRDHLTIALRQTPPLESAIEDLLHEPVRLAFSSGAPEGARNRKASALAIDLQGRPHAFLKLARSAIARQIITNEASLLPKLAHIRAPRLLLRAEIDGTAVMAQTPLAGGPAPLEFGSAHADYLSSFRSGKRAIAAETEMLLGLTERLRATSLDGLSDALARIMPAMERLYVPVTIVHGDFAPWNLRIDQGHISAFDWEYGELSGLPLIDEIHYRLQVGLLLEKWTPQRAMAAIIQVAKAQLLNLPDDDVLALAGVYLIDMLARLLIEGYPDADEMIVWHRAILDQLLQRRATSAKDVVAV